MTGYIFSIAIGVWSMLGVSSAWAQSNPLFVPLGDGAIGALYVPDSGPAPHIAFLATHRNSSYITHTSTRELASRGFMVLGMNVRFANNEAQVDWQDIALDIRSGVRYLRSQPGITKVILIGSSGGGASVSFYQAVAENGPAYCQGPGKILECSSERLAGFVATDKADGILHMDSHPGNSVNTLRSINASVMDEDKPFQAIDPALDPFSVKNGYNPEGGSVYSEEFIARYTQAQSRRMNALIDKALGIRKKIAEGNYFPTDEAPFVIYRTSARLSDFSMSVHGGTLKPAKLLKNDGSIVTQIVKSVRIPNPRNRENDQQMGSGNGSGVSVLTLTSFLSASAIRSDNSLDGIDWCSANDTTICAFRQINVPALLIAMGAHYFIRDAESLFETAVTTDKDFIVIEGATHGGSGCTACSEVTGVDYSNARKNLYDYVAKWANARF